MIQDSVDTGYRLFLTEESRRKRENIRAQLLPPFSVFLLLSIDLGVRIHDLPLSLSSSSSIGLQWHYPWLRHGLSVISALCILRSTRAIKPRINGYERCTSFDFLVRVERYLSNCHVPCFLCRMLVSLHTTASECIAKLTLRFGQGVYIT